MSRQFHSLLALTVIATGTVAANRFVTLGGVHATAAGRAIGVNRAEGISGEALTVDVQGTAVVEASAAITAGAKVEVATGGKAAAFDAGVAVGVALEAASADGDLIEVLLIPN